MLEVVIFVFLHALSGFSSDDIFDGTRNVSRSSGDCDMISSMASGVFLFSSGARLLIQRRQLLLGK